MLGYESKKNFLYINVSIYYLRCYSSKIRQYFFMLLTETEIRKCRLKPQDIRFGASCFVF